MKHLYSKPVYHILTSSLTWVIAAVGNQLFWRMHRGITVETFSEWVNITWSYSGSVLVWMRYCVCLSHLNVCALNVMIQFQHEQSLCHKFFINFSLDRTALDTKCRMKIFVLNNVILVRCLWILALMNE